MLDAQRDKIIFWGVNMSLIHQELYDALFESDGLWMLNNQKADIKTVLVTPLDLSIKNYFEVFGANLILTNSSAKNIALITSW